MDNKKYNANDLANEYLSTTNRISLTFRVLTSPTLTTNAIEKLPFVIAHDRFKKTRLNSIEHEVTEDNVKAVIVTFIIELDDAINSDNLENEIICWMQYNIHHKEVYDISHVDADLLNAEE